MEPRSEGMTSNQQSVYKEVYDNQMNNEARSSVLGATRSKLLESRQNVDREKGQNPPT